MNDGGLAFPIIDKMESSLTGHPDYTGSVRGGMSLRDYFAAKAMQALITCDIEETVDSKNVSSAIALSSYQIADAMLAERSNTIAELKGKI